LIVRNFNDEEVIATTYVAHRGGIARMLLTSKELEAMDFFAIAQLMPEKEIETHIDPYEEIYFILEGSGIMQVGDEYREVKDGDAIFIPAGKPHGLKNNSDNRCTFLVVAATPK